MPGVRGVQSEVLEGGALQGDGEGEAVRGTQVHAKAEHDAAADNASESPTRPAKSANRAAERAVGALGPVRRRAPAGGP